MPSHFTVKTFKYFDEAHKNAFEKEWFLDNKSLYEDHVQEPFQHLIGLVDKELSPSLKKIKINPKSITRPLRPKNRAEEKGYVKDFSFITLWEKRTSLFEWNPAIHIQFGHKKEDNIAGVGAYMISSRQMKKLREGVTEDYAAVKKIFKKKSFKETWGDLMGEKYKRFPKGYDPSEEGAEFLWHKQFYVGKQFTRTEVKQKDFAKTLVKDLKKSLDFFQWTRDTLGTYRPGPRKIKDDPRL